jgi:hypothetical protein
MILHSNLIVGGKDGFSNLHSNLIVGGKDGGCSSPVVTYTSHSRDAESTTRGKRSPKTPNFVKGSLNGNRWRCKSISVL